MSDTRKIEFKKALMIGAAAVAVVAVGAFCVGKSFGKNRSRGAASESRGGEFRMMLGDGFGRGAGGMRFGGQGGGFIGGEIVSRDDTSLVVKLPTGGTKLVFFSASTEIGKTVSGLVEDLQPGQTVVVTGKTGEDGNLMAQSIQLRPLPAPPSVTEQVQ